MVATFAMVTCDSILLGYDCNMHYRHSC